MTASAPAHEQAAQIAVPCLLILPSQFLPPLECCFGAIPIQAEKLRPDRKDFGSAMAATKAVASRRAPAMPELSLMQLGSVSTRRVAVGQTRPVRLLCLKIGPCRITGCGISIAVSHLRP